jgi:hypothetical protein
MSEEGSSGWKFLSIILIACLIGGCFVGLYVFSQPSLNVSAQPNFIEVSVEGPKKLSVNETGVYHAVIGSVVSGNLIFNWTVNPQDNKILLVSNGAFCNLTFTQATEEPYLLSVQVTDKGSDSFGSGVLTIYDPFTSSNLYLNSLIVPYSYIVESDGRGWTRLLNGSDGQVISSSTNASYIFDTAMNLMNVGDSLCIKAGDYAISNDIAVPSGVYITGVGEGSRLYLPDNQPEGWATHRIFFVDGVRNVTIENLCIDGNYRNNPSTTYGALIDIYSSSGVNVYHNFIVNGRVFGVSITAVVANCTDIRIIGNTVRDCKWNGVSVTDWNDPSLCSYNNIICNNVISGSCDYGISIFADAGGKRPFGNIVSNNVIDCAPVGSERGLGFSNTYWGVRIEAGVGNKVLYNSIVNCLSGVCDSDAQGFCSNNAFIGNTIWMNGPGYTYAGITSVGIQNLIKDNIIFGGYVDWSNGIVVFGNNSLVESNEIWEVGGHANMGGITLRADTNPSNVACLGNMMNCTGSSIVNAGFGTGNYFHDNFYGGAWHA